MRAYVVDTNVPVVASGRSNHASVDCVAACVEALQEIAEVRRAAGQRAA